MLMSALSGLALKDKKYWGIIVPVGIGLFGLYYRKTHKLNTLEDEIILGASPSEERCLWCCKKFVQVGGRKNSLYHSEAHRKLGLQKLKWNLQSGKRGKGIIGDTIGKLMRQLQRSGKNGYGARGWIDATYANYKIGSKTLHPAGLAHLLRIYVRDDVYTVNKEGKILIFKWKKGHCLKNWLKPKYVKYLTTTFSAEEYTKKKPNCNCGATLQWDNVRKAWYCIECPFNTYPKKAESEWPEYYVHSPDEYYGPYDSLREAVGARKRLEAKGIEVLGITLGRSVETKNRWKAESFESHYRTGAPHTGKKPYTKKDLKWMYNRPPGELVDIAIDAGVTCAKCGEGANMFREEAIAMPYSSSAGGTTVYYNCNCGHKQVIIFSAEEEEETEGEHPHGPLYCDVCERHYGRKVMLKPKIGEEPRPDVFTDCLCGRKERARKMEDESSFGRKLKKLREEGRLSTDYYDEERPTVYEVYPRDEPSGAVGAERRKEHWPPTSGMHWYDEIGEQMTFWRVPSWHTACSQCGEKTTKGGLLQIDEGSMGAWEEPSVYICIDCVNESELLWWAITGAKPDEPRNPLLKGLLAESFEAITVDSKPKVGGGLICTNCNDGYNVVTCDECGKSWCDDCDTKEDYHNCNTKGAESFEADDDEDVFVEHPVLEEQIDTIREGIEQVGQFARDANKQGESAFYTGYQMALETIVHALETVGRDRTVEEMYTHVMPGLRETLQEARESGSIDNVWEVKGAIEASVEMIEFLSEFPPEWAMELAAESFVQTNCARCNKAMNWKSGRHRLDTSGSEGGAGGGKGALCDSCFTAANDSEFLKQKPAYSAEDWSWRISKCSKCGTEMAEENFPMGIERRYEIGDPVKSEWCEHDFSVVELDAESFSADETHEDRGWQTHVLSPGSSMPPEVIKTVRLPAEHGGTIVNVLAYKERGGWIYYLLDNNSPNLSVDTGTEILWANLKGTWEELRAESFSAQSVVSTYLVFEGFARPRIWFGMTEEDMKIKLIEIVYGDIRWRYGQTGTFEERFSTDITNMEEYDRKYGVHAEKVTLEELIDEFNKLRTHQSGMGTITLKIEEYDPHDFFHDPTDKYPNAKVEGSPWHGDVTWDAEDIDTYRGKRKAPTPEPGAPGTSKKGTGPPMKVQGVSVYSVQEHHAEKRGPHRDIRIGYDDPTHGPVLLSFVPTGDLDNKIPTKVGRNHKITVIQTEDHPFDYWHFEGSIPSGSYGAGPVSLETYGKSNIISYEPGKKLKVEFTGGKYPGTYVFIHYRGKVWGMWRYE